MSGTYHVTLINLTARARAIAAFSHLEQRDMPAPEVRDWLANFCAIPALDLASADAEIRVQVRRENYLLRAEQGRLVFYDMNHRELPAQLLTVPEAMQELDGTAAAARERAVQLARAAPRPEPEPAAAVVGAPASSRPRLAGLLLIAGLLGGAIFYFSPPAAGESRPPGFAPVESAEWDALHATLAGVYMTGSEPGQHGVVIANPGEMKLFELGVVQAPRIVYANYQPGRVGEKLLLVTDQPGGLIEVTGSGSLIYCGEMYRRIP